MIPDATADRHVYRERPMTQTAEQARRVVAAVARSAARLQVGVPQDVRP